MFAPDPPPVLDLQLLAGAGARLLAHQVRGPGHRGLAPQPAQSQRSIGSRDPLPRSHWSPGPGAEGGALHGGGDGDGVGGGGERDPGVLLAQAVLPQGEPHVRQGVDTGHLQQGGDGDVSTQCTRSSSPSPCRTH